jgi:hypothetical protein
MGIQIPLLTMSSRPGAKAHMYPLQIGLQTLEFLQASVLFASFSDIAAGEAVRMPQVLAKIEKIFTESLDSKETYKEAWEYLEKYRYVFERTAFQSVLIALNSHWDWYMRKLGEFIMFARTHLAAASLSVSEEKQIRRVGMLPIQEQLEVLESRLGIPLSLSGNDRTELVEMCLVRNLGLHSRWEVDERYLSQTVRGGYRIGDLRIIDQPELHRWHALLIKLINSSSAGAAKAYVAAPPYPASG